MLSFNSKVHRSVGSNCVLCPGVCSGDSDIPGSGGDVWDAAGVQTGARAGGEPHTLEIPSLMRTRRVDGPNTQALATAKDPLTPPVDYYSYDLVIV